MCDFKEQNVSQMTVKQISLKREHVNEHLLIKVFHLSLKEPSKMDAFPPSRHPNLLLMSLKAFCQQVARPRFKLWLKISPQTTGQSSNVQVFSSRPHTCSLISCESVYFAELKSGGFLAATVPSVWSAVWLGVCPSEGRIKAAETPKTPRTDCREESSIVKWRLGAEEDKLVVPLLVFLE